jgi:hypothetical protein
MIFTSFDQLNFMSRFFTFVNYHFKLLDEFGRGLVLATRGMRINNSNGGSSS